MTLGGSLFPGGGFCDLGGVREIQAPYGGPMTSLGGGGGGRLIPDPL